MTLKEMVVQVYQTVQGIDARMDSHLAESAAALARLHAVEREHGSMRRDVYGADGNNGLKGRTTGLEGRMDTLQWILGIGLPALFTLIVALAKAGVI